MRAVSGQQPGIVQRGHQRGGGAECGQRTQVEVPAVEVVEMDDVGRLRSQAQHIARPWVAKVFVPPDHIEDRRWLGEKAGSSRRPEVMLVAQPIMGAPTDAAAVPQLHDSGF